MTEKSEVVYTIRIFLIFPHRGLCFYTVCDRYGHATRLQPSATACATRSSSAQQQQGMPPDMISGARTYIDNRLQIYGVHCLHLYLCVSVSFILIVLVFGYLTR